MIIKIKIGSNLYDVISYEEFKNNHDMYMKFIGSVAVQFQDGLVYPLRNSTDIRPGLYCNWPLCIFKPPYINTFVFIQINNILM